MPLHVVLCQERGEYLVQCIEHDIAATGPTIEEAKKAFAQTIIRHVLAARQFGVTLFEGLPEAPAKYREIWSNRIAAGSPTEPLEIPPFTIKDRKHTDTLMPSQVAEMISA